MNPRLTAHQAWEHGLINRVFPDQSFEADVRAIAERLAAGPTGAYGIAKRLINQAAGVDQLDYHLDEELQHLTRTADGAEFAEGIAAFFAKRAPDFETGERPD